MDTLFQQFETPLRDAAGDTYTIFVQGRSRPHDTWEAWLVFERRRDTRRFATPAETTQPDAPAVLYWASGLTTVYLEGALDRALQANIAPRSVEDAPPLLGYAVDAVEQSRRLSQIERHVLALFQNIRITRLLAERVYDRLPYPREDVTIALGDLDSKKRLITRRSENGIDWIVLTEEGVRATGLHDAPRPEERLSL